MQREQITETFAAIEKSEPVNSFVWQGVCVWPILRNSVALKLHQHGPTKTRHAKDIFTRIKKKIARQVRNMKVGLCHSEVPISECDVVVLTLANRWQKLGKSYVHSFAEPIAEALCTHNWSVSVWEFEHSPTQTQYNHVSLEQAFVGSQAQHHDAPLEPEPAWFAQFERIMRHAFEYKPAWREVGRTVARVFAAADFFEKRLKTANPKLILIDCWYNVRQMGMLLAAGKLGIPTVDVQHGLQGKGHFAYAGWAKAPNHGLVIFPNQFWVWGEWDKQALVQNNPGMIDEVSADVLGNLWLNKWRNKTDLDQRFQSSVDAAHSLVRGATKVVLVTLQVGVPFDPVLRDLLSKSPSNWLWLIRLHRRMDIGVHALEVDLKKTRANVNIVDASTLPLYALMQACTWHMTWFSTCALEALAFGKPTLLIHESGSHAFESFVSKNVMHYESNPSAAMKILDEDTPSARACVDASRNVFAETVDVEKLVRTDRRSKPDTKGSNLRQINPWIGMTT